MFGLRTFKSDQQKKIVCMSSPFLKLPPTPDTYIPVETDKHQKNTFKFFLSSVFRCSKWPKEKNKAGYWGSERRWAWNGNRRFKKPWSSDSTKRHWNSRNRIRSYENEERYNIFFLSCFNYLLLLRYETDRFLSW